MRDIWQIWRDLLLQIMLAITAYNGFISKGKGTMTWKKSGAIYDGDWKDDHRCGFGTYSVPEGGGYRKVYSGGWKNDKRHVCIHGIYRNVQLLSATILIEFLRKQ